MGLAHVTLNARVAGILVRRQRILLTRVGPFAALSRYFVDNQALSLGWQTQVAHAVGLLIDFMHANGHRYPGEAEAKQVLPDFALALREGTIRDGQDVTELFWEGMPPGRCNLLVSHVCRFSDWLVSNVGAKGFHAWRAATLAEQLAYWRGQNKARAGALLRHLEPGSEARAAARRAPRVLPFATSPEQAGVPIKRFPDNRIMDLLFTGFAKPHARSSAPLHLRYSLRDMLITILMHGGGLRESEAFHIFVNDVVEDPNLPGSALVRVYHPENGAVTWNDPLTRKRITTDRTQFLARVYEREPRNRLSGKARAGWKNPALTDAKKGKYMLVTWFPVSWGRMFWTLYKSYMLHIYPKERLDHPYLFVSLNRKHHGQPYTVAGFNKRHAEAVARIGLTAAKHLGTTPHGHRHALGVRMDKAGVPGNIQTKVLHHSNPMSRLVYNARTDAEINAELSSRSAANPGVDAVTSASAERLEDDINTFLITLNPAHRLTLRRRQDPA